MFLDPEKLELKQCSVENAFVFSKQSWWHKELCSERWKGFWEVGAGGVEDRERGLAKETS
jgi:hypothetical protein